MKDREVEAIISVGFDAGEAIGIRGEETESMNGARIARFIEIQNFDQPVHNASTQVCGAGNMLWYTAYRAGLSAAQRGDRRYYELGNWDFDEALDAIERNVREEESSHDVRGGQLPGSWANAIEINQARIDALKDEIYSTEEWTPSFLSGRHDGFDLKW